ncbi:putative MFS monosaccharide transporter [Stipitochalara longipes BDJ]|nr:putative MFS monosaccharide transporter [Stipitochalara longipes BDJ]
MSRDHGILGRQISPRSSDSPKSSTRHSSNSSNASLPTIVEVPEDVDTRGDPYVTAGFRGVLKSPYCARLAAFAAVGGFALGYNQGLMLISGFNEQFISQFPQIEDVFWYNFVVAMFQLGGLLGALTMGSVADYCSTKRSISIAAVILTMAFVLQLVSMNYVMLVVARLISGIAVGLFSVITPIYISGISPSEIRGSLLVFMDIAIVIGTMASFWTSFATRYLDGEDIWRLPFVFPVVPSLVLGIGGMCLPYSPRWLASRFENQQALYCLAKLRRLSPDNCKVQNEWMEMRVEAAYQREITEARHPLIRERSHVNSVKLELALWLDCFKHGYWKRTHIAVGMMLFKQFVGVNALAYNVPTLMRTLGVNNDMQLVTTGILGVAHLLGAISCLWTIDTIGRKRLLVFGSTLMLVSLVIIAGLNSKFSYNWSAHHDAGWICVGFSFLCMFVFGASWSPISWALPSELFPSTLRAKGGALSSCSFFLNDFLTGFIARNLLHKSEWGTFGFFAVFCLLSGLWVYFVPETKERALEDMDKVFGCNEEQKKKDIRKTLAIGYSPEPFNSPGGTPTNGIRFV